MPGRDALALLKADHDEVKRLFAEFGELGERAVKSQAELSTQICRELTVHAQIEEEVFYPQVRTASKDEEDEVLEALEEHQIVKTLVAELTSLTPEDDTFSAKMQVLQEQVEHHVKEEESEMFPAVRKLIDHETLVEIGSELERAKAAAMETARTA